MRGHTGLLALWVLALLTGCATSSEAVHERGEQLDTGGGGPGPLPPSMVRGRLLVLDDFEALLQRAGLNDSTLRPVREADFNSRGRRHDRA